MTSGTRTSASRLRKTEPALIEAPETTRPAQSGTTARLSSCSTMTSDTARGRSARWDSCAALRLTAEAAPMVARVTPVTESTGRPKRLVMPQAQAGITKQLTTTTASTSSHRRRGATSSLTVKDIPRDSTVAMMETATPALKRRVTNCSTDRGITHRPGAVARAGAKAPAEGFRTQAASCPGAVEPSWPLTASRHGLGDPPRSGGRRSSPWRHPLDLDLEGEAQECPDQHDEPQGRDVPQR